MEASNMTYMFNHIVSAWRISPAAFTVLPLTACALYLTAIYVSPISHSLEKEELKSSTEYHNVRHMLIDGTSTIRVFGQRDSFMRRLMATVRYNIIASKAALDVRQLEVTLCILVKQLMACSAMTVLLLQQRFN
ncbi:hypothetical protein EC988_010104, partial [Linderina pennispora]